MQLAALLAASCATLSEARGLHQGALRGAALAPPTGSHDPKWGSKTCPCVGISGVTGEFTVVIGNKSNAGVTALYPADVGSYCKTWDDGQDPLHCQDSQKPGKGNGWCAQPWCYVDACNCEGIDNPPKLSHMLPEVIYEGRRLYFSYATCDGEDRWPVDVDALSCTHAETEDACDELDECIWGETTWGTKCLGWEAGGMCNELPKQSHWGDHDCPCIGFGDVNGTLRIPIDGKTVEYLGELGSTCKPWHMDHLTECKGENKAEWCSEPWCFVDIDHCTSVTPRPSIYLPDAMWSGNKLHFSYETCGGKGPPEEPAPAPAPAAKEPEEEEKEKHASAPDGLKKETGDPKKAAPTGMDGDYDHGAYKDEWRNEWRHGNVPAFRDLYPEAKKFEDRQSDGTASKVPSGK